MEIGSSEPLCPLERCVTSSKDYFWVVASSGFRSNPPELFLGKGVLDICSKFTGQHPCWNVISIKLLCNFIEMGLRHGCSPVNLVHVFRTSYPKNTSGGLLLRIREKELVLSIFPVILRINPFSMLLNL